MLSRNTVRVVEVAREALAFNKVFLFFYWFLGGLDKQNKSKPDKEILRFESVAGLTKEGSFIGKKGQAVNLVHCCYESSNLFSPIIKPFCTQELVT